MERIVRRRQLDDAKNNIFTSPYFTTMKFGVIILVPPTETHFGGVNISVHKTKREALNYNPEHPSKPFQDFEKAKEYFEDYVNFENN